MVDDGILPSQAKQRPMCDVSRHKQTLASPLLQMCVRAGTGETETIWRKGGEKSEVHFR